LVLAGWLSDVGLFHFNPLKQSAFLEVLTEVVVLISLFSAGVKMPVPVSFARWSPALPTTCSACRPARLFCHPDDRDLLRFTLTCEAGINDGSAFPFVVLGLGLLGVGLIGTV